MTPVTPSFAHSVQASAANYSVSSAQTIFDWSKGAAQKNSARITATKLPGCPKPADKPQDSKITSELSLAERISGADFATKVFLLLQAAGAHQDKVPALLANEAKQMNAVEFAELMSALEDGGLWSDFDRYFVFKYASGSVGSVWLGGCEVYNSFWKNC